MTSECKQQFTLRISQANPTQMVVILYEMLLVYLDEAIECHALDKKADFAEAIRKARGCINELLGSLHYEYEPALNIHRLLFFCVRRLAYADVRKETKPIEEIKKVIIPLKDAYKEVAKQNPAGPIMGNSQAVYAGLTYGKNTLTENMADQGSNRGMLA